MSEKCNGNLVFGKNVFSDSVMRERLDAQTYALLRKTIDEGAPLDPQISHSVAEAMKNWAVENGATHYTHWFQPLHGVTAEKHEAFIIPTSDGKAIAEFSGKALVKGESDASSFPSGGLRATFEARGYTTWDCTSPAFLKEDGSGVTLCIPTAFCSFNGQALDEKTPLLRSMEALNKQAVRLLSLFGEAPKRVLATVGAEQEYFLINSEYFNKRMDLVLTGRTLFGARPVKSQEMVAHYYGTIKEYVNAYMSELDKQLWKMGVPAKTKHNEAGPAQHELAPYFSTVNIAADHNQLIMETMQTVAQHHKLACLLHEKPFEYISGSGKHNNWALCTDTGENLFDPGKTREKNARFLLLVCAVLKAVDNYADLVRFSAATLGNDHRLGGHEAPPSIISIFLGEDLTGLLEAVERGEMTDRNKGKKMQIGVSTLPNFTADTTDRNRTSPFAFTGNKFEFRMLPSSVSISMVNTILNTIVAQSFCEFADQLEKADSFETALTDLIAKTYKDHKRVVYNKNGYSPEWIKQAAALGLGNIDNSLDATKVINSDKTKALFSEFGVFSDEELDARYDILIDNYINTLHLETKTMLEMANRQILPACIAYHAQLAGYAKKLEGIGVDAALQRDLVSRYGAILNGAFSACQQLEKDIAAVRGQSFERAKYYRDVVRPSMEILRSAVDALEINTSVEAWPLPGYFRMLFNV